MMGSIVHATIDIFPIPRHSFYERERERGTLATLILRDLCCEKHASYLTLASYDCRKRFSISTQTHNTKTVGIA